MKPKFFRKVLKNGMTVILEKRDLPVVSVAFAVRCGGINECEEEKGISHFIEHMLYKGTPTRSAKKIAEEIELNGGELNGFTSEEITAYWCKMPSRHLDVALNVLSDMVKNPKFDEKELEKERQVIFEEIKLYKDNPRMHVLESIGGLLYEKPFGIPIIGTVKSLSSINRKKITEKFKKTYAPNNLVLCVVGDANFETLVNFAEENFGKENGEIPLPEIKEKNEIRVEKRKGIDQANLVFAYSIPTAGDKKNYAARILSVLMAGGMSSRLFEEIREKKNLAYAVKGESSIGKNFAFNMIYVGTTPENVEKVKKIILEEFEKVAKNLTEKELGEIKEQVIGSYLTGQEDSQVQMVNLLASEIDGDAKSFYDFEKEIKKVKLKDVRDLATIKDFSFLALVPS